MYAIAILLTCVLITKNSLIGCIVRIITKINRSTEKMQKYHQVQGNKQEHVLYMKLRELMDNHILN